jgi:type II secretory pathway component GspD/PulD (secretin)
VKHFALALLVAALPNVGRASARPSVDLDVKDEDVVVVLKSMQKQCGIRNLVIDKEVQGKGTFIFHDLSCERAFDTVFRTMSLRAKIYSNDVINVSPRSK